MGIHDMGYPPRYQPRWWGDWVDSTTHEDLWRCWRKMSLCANLTDGGIGWMPLPMRIDGGVGGKCPSVSTLLMGASVGCHCP